LTAKTDEAWRTLSAERVVGDWYLFVGRAANGLRWRYSVTPLTYVVRPPRRASQFARALGYCKSFDRAVRSAETALAALVKLEGRER
jgi:hypothetical protein